MILGFLLCFSMFRHGDPLASCHNWRQELPADTIEIAGGEKREEMQLIFDETLVAHLPEIPLTLDHLEWMFDKRADRRELSVVFLLCARKWMVHCSLVGNAIEDSIFSCLPFVFLRTVRLVSEFRLLFSMVKKSHHGLVMDFGSGGFERVNNAFCVRST